MPVTSVDTNTEALTLTLVAELPAAVERAWKLWSDRHAVQRWWGPPGYPATFTRLELEPGGVADYYMTGPDGKKYGGWWRVTRVEAPHRLAFVDGFADEEGNPAPDMPESTVEVSLTPSGEGSRLELQSKFPSREAMDKNLEMGAVEGITAAVNQMDALLTR